MTIVVVCVADSAAELVAKARSLSAKACVTALCEDDSCPCAGEDRIVRIGRVADDCAQGTRIAQALKVTIRTGYCSNILNTAAATAKS